jgi:5-methyltetrahydrofolate--homocysteine methyltransferase
MPDIQMRFHTDMLVLSSPIDAALVAQGVDVETQRELLSVIEPETIDEALRLQSIAGAPCLVTPTNGITRARLAHNRLEDRDEVIAHAALDMVRDLAPQHIIAEIGPTRLPIDPTSKTSLVANRDQYAGAVTAFGTDGIDAFFLNGMADIDDMRCALMGVRKMCDVPVIASIGVDAHGNVIGRDQSIEDAVDLMEDFEADVIGFSTTAQLDAAAAICERACRATELPILVQLEVNAVAPRQRDATPENPYFCADTMVGAAMRLRGAGAQFLRASGAATAAYAGALVASIAGTDAIR